MELLNRFTHAVIFSAEVETVKEKATEFYPTLISIIDSLCKDREAVQGVENV